jgi:hypothetical protein
MFLSEDGGRLSKHVVVKTVYIFTYTLHVQIVGFWKQVLL